MDLWNNEIVGYGLSSRKGDRNTYFEGLEMVAEKLKKIDGLGLILHTDQGSVYASKSFNELLPQYHITHSMSRTGTPTDNGAMEAINGWSKVEMFVDFDLSHCKDAPSFVERYIKFFNEERPSYALGYLTPRHTGRCGKPGRRSLRSQARSNTRRSKRRLRKQSPQIQNKCLQNVD